MLNKSKIITTEILIEEKSYCRGHVATEIEFPGGVGSPVTFQSRELSMQPRWRSMVTTRKRSRCLIKAQVTYGLRKSIQHKPERRRGKARERESLVLLGERVKVLGSLVGGPWRLR